MRSHRTSVVTLDLVLCAFLHLILLEHLSALGNLVLGILGVQCEWEGVLPTATPVPLSLAGRVTQEQGDCIAGAWPGTEHSWKGDDPGPGVASGQPVS